MAITRTFTDDEDYIGLEVEGKIVLSGSTLNKASNITEKTGANGAYVAHKVFGTNCDPTSNYKIVADVTGFTKNLGQVYNAGNATGTKLTGPVALASIQVSTSAGGEPTMTATGVEIEAGGTAAECVFATPEINLSPEYHAQNFGAFTFAGSATCDLSESTFEASATVQPTSVDGVRLASDAHSAKATVSVTLWSSGEEPTITAAAGWHVENPLTRSRDDGDFPTWTISFAKFLTAAAPAAASQS